MSHGLVADSAGNGTCCLLVRTQSNGQLLQACLQHFSMCPEAGPEDPVQYGGEGVPGAAAPQLVPRLPKSRQQERAQLLCSGKTQGPGSITEEPFYGQRN